MLRLLVVFVTISVVCCNQNCPAYSAFDAYPQTSGLQSILDGTFLVVYTSAQVVNCHRVTYVTDANNVTTGQVQSPNCCVKTDNYAFNANELNYDVGPVSGYTSSCPSLVQESGSMKLLGTTGSGSSLCLIVAVCQPDYYGINVSCRGSAPFLLDIIIFLYNLLGSLTDALALKSVGQNCVLPTNTCP